MYGQTAQTILGAQAQQPSSAQQHTFSASATPYNTSGSLQEQQQSPPSLQTFRPYHQSPLQLQSYGGGTHNAPPSGTTTTVTTTSAAAEAILASHHMEVDRPAFQFPPIGEGMMLYMCSKCKCRSHARFARNWHEVKQTRTGIVLYSPGVLLCRKCAEININVHDLVAKATLV